MQRRKVHRKKAADTWSVLLFCREISKRSIMPHIRFRSDVYRSFVSHSRPLLYPIFSPSPSPSFLLARSISFSPSSFLLLPPPDRKQIRDTAAAQQQVARFACRVFRVTRGNRHGNLIFTEKLITRRLVYIHDRVSCIVQGILPPGAGNGRPFIAWPPIPEREREREREEEERSVGCGNFACHCDWRLTKGGTHILLLFLRFRERQEIYLYCWSTIVVPPPPNGLARLNREFGRKYQVIGGRLLLHVHHHAYVRAFPRINCDSYFQPSANGKFEKTLLPTFL